MIDLQNTTPTFSVPLNHVGIKNLKHPATIVTASGELLPTIANFDLVVGLHKDQRGTHMSRFVEVLNQQHWVLSQPAISELLQLTADKLNSDSAHLTATATYFINKQAPVTDTPGLVDYEVQFSGTLTPGKPATVELSVTVPVTTLCPCSKEISDYGAHNQRAYACVTICSNTVYSIEQIVALVEQQASCAIYSILKRPDEKFVTEYAYNNPRFVEDLARNIGEQLSQYKDLDYYKVAIENLESIHNHTAYAMLEQRN